MIDTPEALLALLQKAIEPGKDSKKFAKELTDLLKKEREALLELARSIECADCEDLLLLYLESEKEVWQRLGLALLQKLRRPTLALLEPIADLSRQPGAMEALLRFPKDAIKKELRSLIKSTNEQERIVGLSLARHLGDSAREYAPLISEVFAQDLHAGSALAAIHTLAALLPDDELATALNPAIDHWDKSVQEEVKRRLQAVAAPIRDSVWEGHPFSQSLRVQLQRLGFVPKGFALPTQRPLPARELKWGERTKEDDAAQLSPAVWAFLYSLQTPPYHLYNVSGSYEDSYTFHFSQEAPIFVCELHKIRHLMHVIGDGSIGYFAAIDLLDTSDDPAVYYLERWHSDGWRVSGTLSRYLRSLWDRKRP